jgi:hypothetical protein
LLNCSSVGDFQLLVILFYCSLLPSEGSNLAQLKRESRNWDFCEASYKL